MATNSNRPDLEAFLDHYAAAWRSNDADAIASHWSSDRFVFYKAEEVASFFHDWQQVLDYWRHNEALHDAICLRFSDIHGHELAPDLWVADVAMRWDIRFAADASLPDGAAFPHRGQAMGGDNHVLIFLCASDAGWKLCGWSETPDAAISYLRQLYFSNADANVV